MDHADFINIIQVASGILESSGQPFEFYDKGIPLKSHWKSQNKVCLTVPGSWNTKFLLLITGRVAVFLGLRFLLKL